MKRSRKNAKRRTRMLATVKAGGERLGVARFHRARRMRHEDDGRGRLRIERHNVNRNLHHGGRVDGDTDSESGW